MNQLKNIYEIDHGSRANKPMEGLRGIAVALVFFVHYSAVSLPLMNKESFTGVLSQTLASIGNIGVDLFFLMSGYFIYGMIVRKKDFSYRQYFLRRIIRIYPAFIAVFIIYVVLSFLFPSENKIPNGVIDSSIYLVQNLLLLPGLFPIKPMITVAWSLSFELFYYLLIPLLLIGLRLLQRSLQFRLMFWGVISIISFSFYIYFDFAGPVRLLLFVSGILLFELEKFIQFRGQYWGDLAFILSLVFETFCYFIPELMPYSYLVLFVMFFVVGHEVFSRKGWLGKFTCYSPVRYLGNISYSFYLIHGLTLKFLFLITAKTNIFFWGGDLIFYALLIPYFLISFFVSTALFVTIERPFSLDTKRS